MENLTYEERAKIFADRVNAISRELGISITATISLVDIKKDENKETETNNEQTDTDDTGAEKE